MSEAPDPSAAQTAGQETSSETEGAAPAAPFYDAFPDDLKAAPAVIKYKSVEELARGLVAAENRLGTPADQLLRKPKGLDDKEGIGAIFKALGTPDTPEGYKLEMGEGASPEDLAMGQDFIKHMHETVAAPPLVVKAAVDWFNKQTLATAQAAKDASAAAEAAAESALKTEWGAAYDAKSREVGRLLTELGGADLEAELAASGLGNNARLMSALGKIVDKVAEPGALEAGRPAGGVLTPGQAKAARLALENDPIKGWNGALSDGSHSMHKAVVEERTNYFKLENPPKA